MANIEKAPETEVDSHESIVIQTVDSGQSASVKDTTGGLAGADVKYVQGAKKIADVFGNEDYRKTTKGLLKNGVDMVLNAQNEELDSDDIDAIRKAASLNKQEGGTGTFRVVDVHSDQKVELDNKLRPLGVESVTHENVFKAMKAEGASQEQAA